MMPVFIHVRPLAIFLYHIRHSFINIVSFPLPIHSTPFVLFIDDPARFYILHMVVSPIRSHSLKNLGRDTLLLEYSGLTMEN